MVFRYIPSSLVFLILILQGLTVTHSLYAGQANVCQKTVYFKQSRAEKYKQPYRIKTYTWCFAIPPRCTNYLWRERDAYRQVWETKSRTEYECCRGYALISGACKPACSFSCQNGGTCSSPNTCSCRSGFSGYNCGTQCAAWTYGTGCSSCNCIKTKSLSCDFQTGKCNCKPGYKGTTCKDQCDQNKNFGSECKGVCKCKNGANCDHITGACTCTAGYFGAFCDTPCPAGTGGLGCKQCQCQNGVCDSLTGLCSSCNPGWKGDVCSEKCPTFFWGQKCTGKCDCNGGECNYVDGKCTKCRPGYTGTKCDQLCPKGFYGQGCTQKCLCKNGGVCDSVNGKCTCKDPGFKGTYCEKRWCGTAKVYGLNKRCDTACTCEWKNTETGNSQSCHSITGVCTCKPGWKGANCDVPCSAPFYGKMCSKTCNCTNGAFCDPASGKCYCQLGFKGDHCEIICPQGKFGLGCSQTCQCYNGAACNATNGACTCKTGWTGQSCERTSCKTCDCNGHGCSPMDGKCLCKPGWTGSKCKQQCATGTYGIGCNKSCSCDANNTASCDNGECKCKTGFSGANCAHACPAKKWGAGCTKTCSCGQSPCNKDTGACECIPGYSGTACAAKCPKGMFGPGCKQKCNHCTSYGGTGECHPVSGQCACKMGFIGSFCECTCPEGFYGKTCTDKCSKVCPEIKKTYLDDLTRKDVTQTFKLSCLPGTGKCLCPAGRKGTKCEKECAGNNYGIKCTQKCDCNLDGAAGCRSSNGLCICKAGYTGPKCAERCPISTFGLECAKKCKCDTGGSIPGTCKMDTGHCYCKAGWMRSKSSFQCDKQCPVELEVWGPYCINPCPKCPRNSICNIENGNCDCLTGYTGKDCKEQCPYPSYGPKCKKACLKKCPKNMCDHEVGCTAFTDKNKATGPTPTKDGSMDPSTLIGIIVGVLLLLVLIIMIVLVFYFKNKMVQLRQQKEHAEGMRDLAVDNMNNDMGVSNPSYDGFVGSQPMKPSSQGGAMDGVSNPGYDGFVGPTPMKIKAPEGASTRANPTYDQSLEKTIDATDPYDDIPDLNVYDEAKIYDNVEDKDAETDAAQPDHTYTEPGSGYLTMDNRSPQPLPEGTSTGSPYADPYDLGPKSPDPVYHNAYEMKAPPRGSKPAVAKKPSVAPRPGKNGPRLPETPDENGYQTPNENSYHTPNPSVEDPYFNAYEHRNGKGPATPNGQAMSPDDMDAIMFDETAEAVPYDHPKNGVSVSGSAEYDKPSIHLRPGTNFGDDMEEIMQTGSNV